MVIMLNPLDTHLDVGCVRTGAKLGCVHLQPPVPCTSSVHNVVVMSEELFVPSSACLERQPQV